MPFAVSSRVHVVHKGLDGAGDQQVYEGTLSANTCMQEAFCHSLPGQRVVP